VNGNQNNQPFLEINTPNPQEPYVSVNMSHGRAY